MTTSTTTEPLGAASSEAKFALTVWLNYLNTQARKIENSGRPQNPGEIPPALQYSSLIAYAAAAAPLLGTTLSDSVNSTLSFDIDPGRPFSASANSDSPCLLADFQMFDLAKAYLGRDFVSIYPSQSRYFARRVLELLKTTYPDYKNMDEVDFFLKSLQKEQKHD